VESKCPSKDDIVKNTLLFEAHKSDMLTIRHNYKSK
jgi:hypothetical protein